ncbi:glycosyl transferase family 2 [Parabacteroides sp. PF5-9]|uniref:cytidylyltransferase domain-containing protein n=1 Tax=Parabacteroides sp. PF5-9 TaxID=1742404 RepID=UPI002474CCF8|nr:glycosyl transferase family 2 [Parabacteroides sp. PF5-9]MDH6358237.1 spore coat polysaccharide biosynthesis protein SpsF (cytidylyltransferase family) [Parabacteroides sp. PF5-9]
MNTEKTVFIIQARQGSSRLPGKILLPFYDKKSLMDLLITKLLAVENAEIVVATSTAKENDQIENLAKGYGVHIFRGEETDVIQRFIDAARSVHANSFIRVCSDNPFLELDAIKALVKFSAQQECDYASFNIMGKPSIKTHYGFWTEFVTLEALEKVVSCTDEKLYHEHVTNYIYEHPEIFNLCWIPGPSELEGHEHIRLTIDTEEDFRNAQQIYADLVKRTPYPTINQIVSYLDTHPDYYISMQKQINKNTKW